MRAVVQRAHGASVRVLGEVVGAIGRGLVVFLGAGAGDTEHDATYLANKVLGLRVFPDADGKMTQSLSDARGELLIVSQFTLYGDVRRGMRPSFTSAMEPIDAERLYESFVAHSRAHDLRVATGRFRADMHVTVENDGPVTILIDSKRVF
jgi:D-tyrosyl-tRNA(Tyr) deacylase